MRALRHIEIVVFFSLYALFPTSGTGQTRARLAVIGDDKKPVPYLRLTLSGAAAPVETQSNGECWLTFAPGQSVLTVYPPANYELVSPPDGQVFLPSDPGQTLRIWIARKAAGAAPATSDRALRLAIDAAASKEGEKERLRLQAETLRQQLDALERTSTTNTARYDSLRTAWSARETEIERINRDLSQLREKIDLRRGELFAAVSSDLLLYFDRLKDLRDALPRAGDAFIDTRIGQRFEQTIERYNVARDSLVRHHAGQAELVGQLWNAETEKTLAAVHAKVLDDTHQRLVLPLNDQLISLFRAVRTSEMRPAAARKKAKKAGNEAFGRLNAVLPLLERDIQTALNDLKI